MQRIAMRRLRAWIALAAERTIVARALATCLVVGVVLTAINHADELWRGQLRSSTVWQIPLTFLVPFLVAMISSAAAVRAHKAAHEPEHGLLERRLEAMTNLSDLDPNPVLWVSQAGVVEYANPASAPITTTWNVGIGEALPSNVFADLTAAVSESEARSIRVQNGPRTFVVRPVVAPQSLLLYGMESSAMKLMEEFPEAQSESRSAAVGERHARVCKRCESAHP